MGLRPDRQIRAIFRRTQESLRCVPTPARPLIDLEISDPLIVTTVEIVRPRNAGLDSSLGKGFKNVPFQPLFFDAPFPAMAMHIGKPAIVSGLWICPIVEAVMIFMRHEVRQAIFPGPGIIGRHLRPTIEIPRLTAHIDHAIDGGAAAQGLAARVA